MRNRKYKAWDSHHKQMRHSDRHDGEFYINTKGVIHMYRIPGTQKLITTYDVLECTGFKDVEGKEIYEGDYDHDGHVVVFCNNCAGWQFGHIDIPTKDLAIDCHACEGHFMFRDHVGEFEIIGNTKECNE